MIRSICPVCEKYVEDYEPSVSCTTVDGVLFHVQCAEEAWYSDPLFQAVAEHFSQKAELSRSAMDDMWKRIQIALEQEAHGEDYVRWESERIERELAVADLFYECGYGPECSER